MTHRESDLAASAKHGNGERETTGRFGEFAYRDPAPAEPVRLQEMAREKEERLRRDFRRLRNEVRNEFRNERGRILQRYEERLAEAKRQFLEDAATSREKFLSGRQQARDEYEETLRRAKRKYEFAVDVLEDHYQTIRRKTTRIMRQDKGAHGSTKKREGETAKMTSNRTIERLDEEIRRIAAEKAREEVELAGHAGV